VDTVACKQPRVRRRVAQRRCASQVRKRASTIRPTAGPARGRYGVKVSAFPNPDMCNFSSAVCGGAIRDMMMGRPRHIFDGFWYEQDRRSNRFGLYLHRHLRLMHLLEAGRCCGSPPGGQAFASTRAPASEERMHLPAPAHQEQMQGVRVGAAPARRRATLESPLSATIGPPRSPAQPHQHPLLPFLCPGPRSRGVVTYSFVSALGLPTHGIATAARGGLAVQQDGAGAGLCVAVVYSRVAAGRRPAGALRAGAPLRAAARGCDGGRHAQADAGRAALPGVVRCAGKQRCC